MPIRITGMNSGLDTESIIRELVSAQKTKVDKYKSKQTKVSWKQDAWKALNTKVYSFYNNVGKMKLSSGYVTRSASVSDNTKAKVTASSMAAVGTQKLAIKEVASSGYVTGGKLKTTDGGKVSSTTTMADLGYTSAGTSYIEVKDKAVDGKTTKIEIDRNTTVSDVVKQLNGAGVKANFDANNQRLFISAAQAGADNDFSIKSTGSSADIALQALGLAMDDTVYNKDTKYGVKVTTTDAAPATFTTKMSELGYTGTSSTITGKANDGTEFSFEMTDDMTIGNFLTKLDQAGVTAKFDTVAQRFFIEGSNVEINSSDDLLSKLGVNASQLTDPSVEKNAGAVRIQGSDAKIELNGVEYTSSNSEFSINGLNITASAVTKPGEYITVNVSNNTEGLYDKMKEFISEYNSLMEELSTNYYAEATKDMDPLTDDQKEEMSDTEIEQWESKIKTALLRRDSTVSSVMTAMTTGMSKTYTINGKAMNLSMLGINTGGYNSTSKITRNSYHIDGDEDDTATSGNQDKLMAAIKEDPDAVVDFMKQLATDVYSNIDKMMKSSSLKSAYNVYNDKELQREYDDYTKLIKKWEQKLEDMEDKYYKQFSAMETALGKLNSQTSSLAGLLGQ